MRNLLLLLLAISMFLVTPVVASAECDPGDMKCFNGDVLECRWDSLREVYRWYNTYQSCYGPDCFSSLIETTKDNILSGDTGS